MTRGFVPVFLVAAALCGFGRVAHADLCPPPTFLFNSCEVTGSIVNGEGQVSVPQIDPALGQGVGFNFGLQATLNGTVTVSYTCPPFQNGREPFCDYGIQSLTPVLSSPSGSTFPFSMTGDNVGGVFNTCAGNPNGQTCTRSFSWSDNISVFIAQDSDPGGQGYNPDLQRLFTGTGQVTFPLIESVTNLAVGGTVVSMSLDPSPYTAVLTYDLFPAVVPEPSLAAVTAVLFGLIVWRRRHR